jgi:GST-like protein
MTIELYSLATPNGQKISIALEEMGLEYSAHKVDISKGEQFQPDFLKISPNNKIPAILDTETGISVFESGSILVYLAEKTGKFLPGTDQLAKRTEVLNWLFWQMGGLGPMSGQMGHFYKYAKSNVSDENQLTYSRERYLKETQRLWGVLEKQFEKHGGDFVIGDELTIADFAIYPWLTCVDWGYGLKDQFTNYPKIDAYIERMKQRPAVQVGEKVTPFQ